MPSEIFVDSSTLQLVELWSWKRLLGGEKKNGVWMKFRYYIYTLIGGKEPPKKLTNTSQINSSNECDKDFVKKTDKGSTVASAAVRT